MLRKTLDSIRELTIPSHVEMVFLLSDNEKNRETEQVLFDFQNKVSFTCKYLVEEKRGIVHNRNNILRTSMALHADFLAFVDDDQTLDQEWLVHLMECQETCQADAVKSKVVFQWPESTSIAPELKAIYEEQKPYETGDRMDWAGTNGVLIKLASVERYGLSFNEKFNMIGGSDSLFFYQLFDQGGVTVACNEAIAYEEIPESRATNSWIIRRRYRVGYTRYYLQKERFGSGKAFFKSFRYCIKKYFFYRRMLFFKTGATLLDKARWKLNLQYIRGIWDAMLGKPFSEYHEIHGY